METSSLMNTTVNPRVQANSPATAKSSDPVAIVADELSLQPWQVSSAVRLLFAEQCTIPFVARYRKEMTGTLDEVKLREIRDRYHYLGEMTEMRTKYLKVVEEQSLKDPLIKARLPVLRAQFEAATTKQQLEDLYLPFKPKRRTRAQIAREKGLEPLLTLILEQRASLRDLVTAAEAFVTPEGATDKDQALKVATPADALSGAADIFGERINETAAARAAVREFMWSTGLLTAKRLDDATPAAAATPAPAATAAKGNKKGDAAKYENYFDYKEPLASAPAHRVMAVRRGEAEKILRLGIDIEIPALLEKLGAVAIGDAATTPEVRAWFMTALDESARRLVIPSIETELRLQLKQRAEEEAIRVFARNLESLLLLPPLPGRNVLGVDPGLRTGSKLAVVSETGKFLHSTTIYPDLGNKADSGPKSAEARATVAKIVSEYKIHCIAVGNGTGSREIDRLITTALRESQIKDVKRVVVNEAGASVYSTDEVAREEFPDLDATIRSAISIARRLQDPLAELVKIDPRSIGVGQYQHDVNVSKLKTSLEEVVESCVNKVGVNLNTASSRLLSYVSGIGPALSKSVVTWRDKNGVFRDRASLMQVPGFGPKAFEQAAGFLRVPESTNPLDNSAVHPERYEIVEQIAQGQSTSVAELIGKAQTIDGIPWDRYVTATVGMPTLRDIAAELVKPGRDPREDGARLLFSDDVATLEDLKPGMKLKGTVTNVTNFGAFVDIGVHQDGLVHISELSDQFVKDPATVVSVGAVLDVRVLDVDMQRRRISLSCKTESTARPAGATTEARDERPPRAPSSAPRPPREGAQGRGGEGGRPAQRGAPGRDRQDPRGGRDQRPHAGGGGAGGHAMHGVPPRGEQPRFSTAAPGKGGRGSEPSGPPASLDDLMAKFKRK